MGSCHVGRSGFDGAWTEEPLKFDNTRESRAVPPRRASRDPLPRYFAEMLAKSYDAEIVPATGCPQHRDAGSGTIMLISDLALLEEPFRAIVEEYAADQDAYFRDFVSAWVRIQENGVANLRDEY